MNLFDKCYLYDVFTSVRESENAKLVSNIYNYLGFSLYDESVINDLMCYEGIVCFLGAGNIDKEFEKIKKIFN